MMKKFISPDEDFPTAAMIHWNRCGLRHPSDDVEQAKQREWPRTMGVNRCTGFNQWKKEANPNKLSVKKGEDVIYDANIGGV